MNLNISLYTLPLFIAALISFGVGNYAWNRRKATKSAQTLALLSWFLTIWSVAYALEIAAVDFGAKLFWGKVQYLGITTTPVFWLIFALRQSPVPFPFSRRGTASLFLLPLLTCLLTFTTETHGLIWNEMQISETEHLSVLGVSYGVWFWVHTFYSYVLLLSGTIVIVRSLSRNKHLMYRRQVAAMIVAVGAPWLGNIVYLTGLSPIPHLDLTPFSFTVTTAAFAWAVLGFRLLDLAPIARDLVVESMEDAMFVVNRENQLVDLNEAGRRLLSAPQGTGIIGQSARQVFSRWPNLVEQFVEVDQAHLELTVGRDENLQHFELRIFPLTGRNQQKAGRLFVLRDITSRKKVEVVAYQESELLQALMDNIPDTIYFKDMESRFTRINRAQAWHLGLADPAEAIGKTDADFLASPELAASFLLEEQALLSTGEPILDRVEYNPTGDGHPRWYSATKVPLRDRDGKITGLVGLSRDITANKQLDLAFHEAQTRYQTLVENLPTVTYIDSLDDDPVTLYVSPQIERLIGYTPEEWIANPDLWPERIHPDDREQVLTATARHNQAGEPFSTEYRFVTKNGDIVWVRDEAVVVRDEAGQLKWSQGVLLDITHRKEAEATQRAFLEDLQALQEIHLVLDEIEQLDALHVKMVELAQTRLGFDRLGLFTIDETTNELTGTFGVGQGGEIRDEHYYREPITENHWTLDILNSPKRAKIWENAPLYDDGKEVGKGWKTATALWSGLKVVGYMVCDNIISRKPARAYELELISILGSIYGHLIEQKRTKTLLQESETRFRQIIENASDVVFRTDIFGNFTYVNPTGLHMIGLTSEEEVLGRNYLDLAVPSQRHELRRTYTRQLVSKTKNTYQEFAGIASDGREVWFGQNVQLIMDGEQVIGFQALARDITQRKFAEQQAATRSAQLQALNQLGREIVATLNVEQICISTLHAVQALMPVDAFFISIYSHQKQEIQDLYMFDDGKRWPNTTRPISERGLSARVVLSGEPLWVEDDLEGQVTAPAGRVLFGTEKDTRSVLVVPLKYKGDITGVISTQHYEPFQYTKDHLELLELLANQVAIALQNAQQVESLRLQAAMLDAAANAIAITDVTGTIQWVNPAFTALTGYSFEEAVGQHTRLLRSGIHPPEFYRPLYEAIMAGKFWQGELINRRKDGTLYHESQTITPIFDEEGQLFRFIAIKQDITELIRTRDQALEASRLKSQLLSRVSHELRTPLSGILGYAELLHHEMFGSLDDKQKRATQQIMDSTNYLSTMVNELLDEAQLAAKSLTLKTLKLSPDELLKKAEATLLVTARNKGLNLVTTLATDMPEIWGDAQRLQQVLINLIGNAIKFTQEGEIRVEIFPVNKKQWSIRVSDTGAGIPPEAQEFIFEPFRQVDNSITHENRGTGLGLSITKQLVELMGGHITVDSEVGRGSTFTVYLPVQVNME